MAFYISDFALGESQPWRIPDRFERLEQAEFAARFEDGGDIAVLRGTTVRLRVTSTIATTAGRVVRGAGEAAPLTVNDDGTLTGGFDVGEDGTYRIDLATPAGTFVSASPQYAIDVLDDEAPVVSFAKPGRDLRSTSIDEVFAEVQADDDFGVARLELVYSVNGGVEKSMRLASGGAKPVKQLSAGHTFFLEGRLAGLK